MNAAPIRRACAAAAARAPAAARAAALALAALLLPSTAPATDHETSEGMDHDRMAGAGPADGGADAAGDRDARSKLTDAGRYRVTVADRPEPLEINVMHAWRVHVETPGGEPVTGAELAIGGGMPAHSHGLPTAPRVTAEPAPGTYLVEGFRFQMPGSWIVTFDVLDGAVQDSVTFELER